MGGPKCIGTIGRKYFGTSSCVLCRETVLISEYPLLEIPQYVVIEMGSFAYSIYVSMYVHTSGTRVTGLPASYLYPLLAMCRSVTGPRVL